ncbi:acylphosphatase [Andreprevotia chitinilytica]|uniref:acylphosphatase n=1 Tax=Andreprevotia chitinilytica TaxID=396808 RepID=UPI000A015943|nr:acylphosphatase [Andreprevotia chitinilytica]
MASPSDYSLRERIAKRLQVAGRVQGVGFRFSTVLEARRLGVRGWVRNRLDGSVEIQAEGTASAVEALVRWAGHGPSGSRVDHLNVQDGELEGCVGFDEVATC